MKDLMKMFISFLKIGAFTFGGGFAMIPLIEAEVVDKNKWLSKDEFTDIIVISQTFPGAIAVNSSLFIGYKMGGVVGALLGMLGVVLPSFFIILIIAMLFMQFRNNYYVDLAFKGITAAVPILVLVAVTSLSKGVDKKSIINIVIFILSVIGILAFDIHPVIIVILSGLIGILFLRKKVN